MATTTATGAPPPKVAVGIAAVLNFVGAFISLSVAATEVEGIVEAGAITPVIVPASENQVFGREAAKSAAEAAAVA